ncbi:MAG: hypothetical protein GWN62_01070 [Aliifodinibius sp.]|nr:hypothetical protein [Fodinibius sp.]
MAVTITTGATSAGLCNSVNYTLFPKLTLSSRQFIAGFRQDLIGHLTASQLTLLSNRIDDIPGIGLGLMLEGLGLSANGILNAGKPLGHLELNITNLLLKITATLLDLSGQIMEPVAIIQLTLIVQIDKQILDLPDGCPGLSVFRSGSIRGKIRP